MSAAAEAEQHAEARAKQAIEFPAAPEEASEPSRLELERAKHKARAEKFGTEYVEPARRRDLRLDARKERWDRPGFHTGIDVFSEEERAKREQRASRFGLPEGNGLDWKPPVAREDEEKKRQRAERFGVEYVPTDETGLMEVDLFEARKDPGVAAERRPEAVHVYGVDLLSTGDILKYFADYGPRFVEWINDSSANVLFADAATAARAVAGLGAALPPDEAPEQMGIDTSDPAALQYLWHKGVDFAKGGTAIPLIFRIATVEDVKPADRVPSRRLWVSAGGGARGGGQQRQRGGQQREGGDDGGERQQRGRGRRRFRVREGGRPAGWQHDDRGEEGGGDGDAAMQQGRKPRRPRNKRARGDVDMQDAEGGGGGGGDDYQEPQRFRPADDDERPAAPPGPAREQIDYGDL